MEETQDTEALQRAQDAGSQADDRVDRGKLSSLLGYHLRRADILAMQQFTQAMDRFEISPAQLGVLLIVQASPGLNQTRVGRALGIDRSTLVSIIDNLEARALVERTPSPTDRRSHALILTARGQKFIDDLTPSLEAHEDDLSRRLTAEERQQLIELLGRIVGSDDA